MEKKRVAILAGGRSNEHQISCISATGVLAAIDRDRYIPIVIGITQEGRWVFLDQENPFTRGEDGLPFVASDNQPMSAGVDGFLVKGEKLAIDILFPLLHGPYGEDGTVQGMLELAGLAYVGSGVLASATAMDKSFAKEMYRSIGLNVAPSLTLSHQQWREDSAKVMRKIEELGFPLFVKPARSGSSRGTSKVRELSYVEEALKSAFDHDNRILIESAVLGREIECAILEIAGVATPSVLGEIQVHAPHEFYDFEAKYLDGSTTFVIPAELSAKTTEEIASSAVAAFRALGCEGLARVDFFLDNSGEVFINEINTMPGFTSTSVFPMLWRATGKEYVEVITILLESAVNRSKSVVR